MDERSQCLALTTKGKRCSRRSRPGSRYCAQHEPKEDPRPRVLQRPAPEPARTAERSTAGGEVREKTGGPPDGVFTPTWWQGVAAGAILVLIVFGFLGEALVGMLAKAGSGAAVPSLWETIWNREKLRLGFLALDHAQGRTDEDSFDDYIVETLEAFQGDREALRSSYAADSLVSRQPPPDFDYSVERFLVAERSKAFNDPNKISYLYLFLPDGSWTEIKILGRLVSSSRRLTPEATIAGNVIPDEKGLYGASSPSKIGMTAEGSLFEIGGFMQYIVSEKQLFFGGDSGRVPTSEDDLVPNPDFDLASKGNRIYLDLEGEEFDEVHERVRRLQVVDRRVREIREGLKEESAQGD